VIGSPTSGRERDLVADNNLKIGVSFVFVNKAYG